MSSERLILERIADILGDIRRTLNHIEQHLRPEITATAIEFYATINGVKEKVASMFLKSDENLPLAIAIKDRKGNAAKVDGAPAWAVTDESLAKLQVAEDGMSATLVPSGTVGTLKVQVKADADLGEGVKEILGELEVEIIPLEAAVIELSAGNSVPQE